jgi:D-alanyl-D-alanine carboxypeptidase (penicillin-binding protein 5/6)
MPALDAARRRGGQRPLLRAMLVVVLLVATPVLGAPVAGAEPGILPPGTVAVPSGVSVLLVEAGSGQAILAVDAERRRPVASTIKLVTALVVADALASDAIVVPGDEVRGVGGASAGLRPGEPWVTDDLLAALLLRSGNDAAVALAAAVAGDQAAFVTRMEERLAGLGIVAELASPSGLEVGDALSAAELAVVARAVLAEPRLAGTAASREVVTADGRVLENRNRLLTQLDGATGLKTGFTSAAGWSLVASAERDGRALVAVVLGAADDAERTRVAAELLEAGFARTARVPAVGTLALRTGRGDVVLRVDAGTLTVLAGARPRAAWPAALDPSSPPARVAMAIDGTGVAEGEVLVDDRRTGTAGASGLGAAAATGAYAALRAAGAAGLLG